VRSRQKEEGVAEQSPAHEPAHEPAEGAIADFAAERVPLIILTGMSGAGRSTAAKVLEDLGWYVVDNLPPQMLDHLQHLRTEAAASNPGELLRLAVVIDARTRALSDEFTAVLGAMRAGTDRPVLIFFDATDEDLVRRFESVRRPHPLQGGGRLLDGITAERELVAELRSNADLLVDTSGLNVHQLTAKVTSLVDTTTQARVRVALMSFGFKYGVPLDADFVFDMRFLPNPFWVPELRPLTGRDAAVAEYVMGKESARSFTDRVVAMMEPVFDGYLSEGRRYATVAVGCTGGKHRSVAVAEHLCARLRGEQVDTFIVHRDLGRE